jgi:hypothetical protein
MNTTIEFDIEVEYTYTPRIPGYLSGSPENCYPEEPECAEITSVTANGVDILNALTTKQLESLEADCCEDAKTTAEDRN